MYTSMRRLFIKAAPLLTVAVFTLVFLALNTDAASAAAATGPGTMNFTFASGAITSIIAFATGPVSKIIAILAIITGAVAFAQGREVSEGLKTLGVVAICCGLLIGAGAMFGTQFNGALI